MLDTRDGSFITSFPTGDFPHENQFSADGQTLYNATIGRVIAPDEPRSTPRKGDRC